MKAWVVRRREDGVVIATPTAVVNGAPLLELVVVEVTEEGKRRPIKLARLMAPGEPRILAQLKMATLVQLRGWTMVLSGIEEVRAEHGLVRGVSQTWLCELQPPDNATGFRVKETYAAGVRLPRGTLFQSIGTCGRMVVAGEHSSALQRHTTCAELHHLQMATLPPKRLVDCQLEFMSESSFGLGGLCVREAYRDRPQLVERGGWLCEFDVMQPQLTKAEYRLLR